MNTTLRSYPRPVLRKILIGLLVLVLLGIAGVFAARQFLPGFVSQWVAGPAFNRMVSKAVSHALKVEGQFGPMALEPGLSVTTEGFTSKGWPGQAIGSLNTGKARGWFDPWAVFRGEWHVPRIDIEKADFRVVTPDNKLKAQDPVIPPKPWYAFFLPSQFTCGWIECPDMSIELPVGAQTVRGANLQVGAMMIGKNFKYFGRNGRLQYRGYPDMAIDALEVYVTHDFIDIGNIYLREPQSAQSNLFVSARLGQHADKSIRAKAEITTLDLRPFLPSDIARILSGKLSGSLNYETDTSGGNAKGGGSLRVDDALIANWDYLDRLAEHARNPSLRRLVFRRVALDYALAGDVFSVSNLNVNGREQIDLTGGGTWNMATDTASVSLNASRIPIDAYLPAKIAEGLRGELSGRVDWSWRGTNLLAGRGGGSLELTGAALKDFDFQKFLSRFLKDPRYNNLKVTRAKLDWKQTRNEVLIDNIDVAAGEFAGLRGSVRVDAKGHLSGTVYAGLPASSLRWLPDATKSVFAKQENGMHWCTVKIWGTEKKPETDFTEQVAKQLDKHPLAWAALAIRGLSWWLGDAFRTKAAKMDEG
ncbi:MAG: hypothetical protein FGM15_07900 [Chthoniobacterales bacterium]|nr:hypothetical protein [Chthoniobacterales bacterium]